MENNLLNFYLCGISINLIIILLCIILFIFFNRKPVKEEDSIKISIFMTFLLLLSFIGTMVFLTMTFISVLLLSTKKNI